MSSYKEKERRKEQQDKFQAILSALLKDDDNKYCVDCDAKGPRWASWNLGIFLCIRCAGIHRNLGVHISKVKSVNLDTWTPEQVAMMQEIGNSRARAAYEANLPDGYRRPQTDSALESFIRAKYEAKKYMAREWVPPQPKVPKEWLEEKTDKKKVKPKSGSSVQLTNIPKPSQPASEVVKPQAQRTEVSKPKPPVSSANDLLGLDLGTPQPQTQQPPISAPSQSGGNDLLDLFVGSQPATQTATATQPQQPPPQDGHVNGSSAEANLFGEDLAGVDGEKKVNTKDSIMALFGGATSQPQMYGVPGTGSQLYPQDMSSNASYHLNGNADAMQMSFHQMGTAPPMTSLHQNQFLPGMDFANAASQISAFDQTVAAFRSSAYPGQPLPVHSSTVIGNSQKTKAANNSLQMGGKQPQNAVTDKNGTAAQRGQWQHYASNQRFNVPPGCPGGMYVPQGQQPMYPGMMGAQQQQQGMMGAQQQGMMGTQQQGMMGTQQPGMMGAQQPGMMGAQQPGMMPQGMMGAQQPGMMPQGMMGAQQQGMMGAQQQGMMGAQQQGMMGTQQQGMMGAQQQGQMPGMMGQQPQGMMGQPAPGMMGNPAMNGSQTAMYGNQGQMMQGYTPQQMQQLQFQQMQQQMSSMKMSGNQMNAMQPPQVQPGAGAWGAPTAGQTLSTNLWQ